MPTVPALMARIWQATATAALAAHLADQPDAVRQHLQHLQGGPTPQPYARRAQQVAVIVWVDAIIAASDVEPGSGEKIRVWHHHELQESAPPPCADWINSVVQARCAGDHQAVARLIRIAEISPEGWGAHVTRCLEVAGLTVRFEQLRRDADAGLTITATTEETQR